MQTAQETHRVSPSRRDSASPVSELERDLARVDRLAELLDARFEVAGFKFGYDGLVGLVPVVGDTLTGVVSCYPIYVCLKHDLGKLLALRMAGNVAADWILGSVPVVGDAFDFVFKAARRNARMLQVHSASRRQVGNARG